VTVHVLCRSPTPTVNDFDLTLLARTQTSELEYYDMMAISKWPSTLYSWKTFLERPYRIHFRGRRNMFRHLWRTTKISQFFDEWKTVL